MSAHLAPRAVPVTIPHAHPVVALRAFARWVGSVLAAYGEREHHRGWQ